MIIALLNKQKLQIGGGGGGDNGDDGINWPNLPTLPPMPPSSSDKMSFSPETLAQLTKFLPKDFKIPSAL